MILIHTANFWTFDKDFGKPMNIASRCPAWYQGTSYNELFPAWSLIKAYKESGDTDTYTKGYYNSVLDKLNPFTTYHQLTKGATQKVVLLCWEKPGDFCHRRLVAEWLERHLGLTVPEIPVTKKEK